MSEVKFKACDLRANAIVVQEDDFDRVIAERDAARMSMTEPPIYTSWRNLERGQHLAVTGVFDDIHMTNAEAILSLQLENSRLRHLLTAADERADVLEGLIGEVLDAVGREPLDLDAVLRLRARMRAALKPAEAPRNQCDGCNAGIPLINGTHRMGREGGYPDFMGCSAKLYKPAAQCEPMALVAVVMPERSNERDHAGDLTYEAKAWNACLDEVKRLNK